jgi:hypothetical protein
MLYVPAALVAFTIFSRPFVFPMYQVEPPKVDCSQYLSPCNIVLTPSMIPVQNLGTQNN